MLSEKTIRKTQEILHRISTGEMVSLEDRVYIQKLAIKNEKVSSWLKRAIRLQNKDNIPDEIDDLINALDLGFSDPQSEYNPKHQDIGEWFLGAPKWLGRS